MRAVVSLCATGLLALVVGPASAVVLVDESTGYYDISGRSVEALRAQLASKGPVGTDGRRFHGLTSWELSFDIQYASEAGSCRISGHEIRLALSIILPRWEERAGASKRLAKTWDAYSEALALHEAGHRDLAVAASGAMDAALGALPAATDCKLLGRSVQSTVSAIQRRLEIDNAGYDQRTVHGTRQGAVL